MLTTEEKKQTESLIRNCNEMIEGKFILADSKVSKILKNTTECKLVYNLLSECMRDFNFDKEFARARVNKPIKGSYFAMPTEERKILAMTFCLLVQIENRIIDFPNFLRQYFNRDGMNEYTAFTSEVIKPFRDIIIKIYETQSEESYSDTSNQTQDKREKVMEEERKLFNEKEVDNEKNEDFYFAEIINISHEIIKTLMFDTRLKMNIKDDATIIAEAMIEACEIENLKLLNGLIIGFDRVAVGIKSIKFVYKELKDIMVEFYQFIQK